MVLVPCKVIGCCTYDGVDSLGGLCVSDAEGDPGFCCNIGLAGSMQSIHLSRETCTKGLLQHVGRSGTQWMEHLP